MMYDAPAYKWIWCAQRHFTVGIELEDIWKHVKLHLKLCVISDYAKFIVLDEWMYLVKVTLV